MTGRRILVVANETADGEVLHETVRARAGHGGRVLVVAPALNSRLRHWTSDEDAARAAAASRLRLCLERLQRIGLDARGVVGDADPLLAIGDALHVFAADEVIAMHPKRRSHLLARGVVGRARTRFGLPVVHVAVDAAAVGEPTSLQRSGDYRSATKFTRSARPRRDRAHVG